jgi:putative ABC transport system substrate-binding protein
MTMKHARVALVAMLALALGRLTTPVAAEAQQAGKVPRVGYLNPGSHSDPARQRRFEAFRQGLRELGYVEGQNITIEFRWAEGMFDRLPGLAAELVQLKVNVILAGGAPAAHAAKQATETIPIVAVNVADPVAMGLVASLARPGGNITGLSLMLSGLVGKQLEILREIVPAVSRVALLGNPANPHNAVMVRQAQDAAGALALQLQPFEARDPSEIDQAFAAITTGRAGAVIVLGDTILLNQRARIFNHAARSSNWSST